MTPGAPHHLGRLQLRGLFFRLSTRGVAAIETAWALPAYLLLLFGVMDMGWLFWKQITIDRAVLIAARCGAVRTTGCLNANDIAGVAASRASGLGLSRNNFQVTTPSCGVKVEISLTHNFFFARGVLGSQTLRANACMMRTDVMPN